MNQEQPRSAAETARTATPTGDLEQQIAAQDATIETLERRLSASVYPRSGFSFARLDEELSMETELSAAREKRGTLLYDRDFVKATSRA